MAKKKDDGPLTVDEALEEFGDYWVQKDELIDWSFKPKRALSPKARLILIVRGMAQGIKQAQIASRCGVDRRTLYTDRNSIDAVKLAEEIMILQLEDIGKLARFPDPKALTLAMMYRDKILQKLIPRRVETRGTPQVQDGKEVKIPDVSDTDIARYIPVIVKLAMEEEARELNEDDDVPDPQEPMD